MKFTTNSRINSSSGSRKRSVSMQELSFISRSLSCLFTENSRSKHASRPESTTTQEPLKKRRCSASISQESPSLCSTSSLTSSISASSPPLPTTISMSSLRQSRSIGKLSQTDSLCSLVVGETTTSSSQNTDLRPPPPACASVSSDWSIRSDLDASFDSRARYPRDRSEDDSLSYSDDSSYGNNSCGWYTDADEGLGEDDGGIFF